MNKILNRLVDLVSNQLGVSKEELLPEADLIKDFNSEKLEIADLFMVIEDEFNIKFASEEIEEIKTIGDLITVVSDHLP